MIDLHIHTNYSDGADSIIEVLKKAEKNKLEYISITDHDNCNAYIELKNMNISDYYTGKIIPGIEIKCAYKGRLIDILGYNINVDKMKKWADNFYANKSRKIVQQKYFDLWYDKCLKMNLILSPKEQIEFDSNKDWASLQIYKDLKKHLENKDRVPEDLWQDFSFFSKKYCANPEHPLYIDKTKDSPTLQETIDAIKSADGLVFVPHLFIYKWADNIENLIDDILNNYDIDGIECYHSEFNEENIEYLKNICKERNYYMSGGSDYHGSNKRGIELAVGKGNLRISSDIIQDWVNK